MAGEVVDRRRVDEAVVGEVVARDDLVALTDGTPEHPLPDADLESAEEIALGIVPDARVVCPADEAARRVDEVEEGSVGFEQPGGFVDRVLEDVRRVAQGGQAGGDLAEAALRVGPSLELGLRPAELLDEPGVRQGDRGLSRERLYDGELRGSERSLASAVDVEHAHRAGLSEQWGRDHRPQSAGADEVVGGRHVHEAVVAQVVVRDDEMAGVDRHADHPAPERLFQVPDLRPERFVLDSRVVRPADRARRVVDEVERDTVRPEERRGRVDRLVEDVRGIAQRGQLGGDPRERLLGRGPPRDLVLRSPEPADKLGIRDGRGGVVGERLDEGDVRVVEGRRPGRVDRERAE